MLLSVQILNVLGWCEATTSQGDNVRNVLVKMLRTFLSMKKKIRNSGKTNFFSFILFSFLFFHIISIHIHSVCHLPSPRSFRCVHGWEHHGSRGDRGGDGSYPAPARGPGAPRVRAALHVSFFFLCVCVFVRPNVIECDKDSISSLQFLNKSCCCSCVEDKVFCVAMTRWTLVTRCTDTQVLIPCDIIWLF